MFATCSLPRFGTTPCGRQFPLWRTHAFVGIDLGTTNSAIATVDARGPRIVRHADGTAAVPSLVAFREDSPAPVAGHAASDAGELPHAPGHVLHSFKRIMGLQAAEIDPEASRRLSYSIVEGDRGEALIRCPSARDLISPEKVSSYLLQHLVQLAENRSQESVEGAVVTVPARFASSQRAATLRAAELAGIPIVHLLQEPVAAALAYGIDGGTDGDTVLVFDLGGGTFDLSLLQAFEGIMEVLGTAGDPQLGGDDFDAALADWIERELPGCPGRGWTTKAARIAKEMLGRSFEQRLAGGDTYHGAVSDPSDEQSPSSSSYQTHHGVVHDGMPSSTAGDGSMQLTVIISTPDGTASVRLTECVLERIVAPLFARMAVVLQEFGERHFVEWACVPRKAVPTTTHREHNAPEDINTSDAFAAERDSLTNLHPHTQTSSREEQEEEDEEEEEEKKEKEEASPGSIASATPKRRDIRWVPPPRRITRVALVGELTRLACVRRFVTRITGVEPASGVDPGEAVALGAAIQAGVLLGSVSGVELMDGSFVAAQHGRATGFGVWQP